MMCDELMKPDVETVQAGDNLHTAARIMRDKGIGFLPVVDELRRPVGAITDRDLTVRAMSADHRPSNVAVREVMSVGVVLCNRFDDINVAEELMCRNQKSRIMCVDEESGALVGVISLSDVAEREPGPMAAQILREVAHREARPRIL